MTFDERYHGTDTSFKPGVYDASNQFVTLYQLDEGVSKSAYGALIPSGNGLANTADLDLYKLGGLKPGIYTFNLSNEAWYPYITNIRVQVRSPMQPDGTFLTLYENKDIPPAKVLPQIEIYNSSGKMVSSSTNGILTLNVYKQDNFYLNLRDTAAVDYFFIGYFHSLNGYDYPGMEYKINYIYDGPFPNTLPTGAVTINGTATQNQVLTVSNNLADADGLGAISYTWLRDGTTINSATQSTYTLTQADVGKKITVKASYTDLIATAESVSSVVTTNVANVNDLPTGSVIISGTPTQNQTLTANNTLADLDGLGTITYQWLSNNKEIFNASQSTYMLTQSDVDNVISVKASYTDASGSKESITSSSTTKIGNVNDAATGNVSISGLAAQGQTLTTVSTLADLDGLGTIKYQWLSNGVSISGATKSSYVLGSSDIGKTISVKASYIDLLGTDESVTSQSSDAVISTKPSKGNDVLTGTAKNDTLSALAGNDTLIGGLGADKLTGGLGADIFKYISIDDSGVAVKIRDTITDFKHAQSDKIDLSAIDANSVLPNDQAFTLISAATFSADATGQLRFDAKTSTLYGSTNADAAPEFAIVLSGVKTLVAEDLIL
jgi:Ca2+-binding RTX toxin-like protein